MAVGRWPHTPARLHRLSSLPVMFCLFFSVSLDGCFNSDTHAFGCTAATWRDAWAHLQFVRSVRLFPATTTRATLLPTLTTMRAAAGCRALLRAYTFPGRFAHGNVRCRTRFACGDMAASVGCG